MTSSKPENEQRKAQRARLHFSLDCSIRFDQPQGLDCIVEDISAGGLRINLGNAGGRPALAAGDAVVGSVESLNPALQMNFRGRVMWVREVRDAEGAIFQAGIAFDPGVVLSELIASLQASGQGAQS